MKLSELSQRVFSWAPVLKVRAQAKLNPSKGEDLVKETPVWHVEMNCGLRLVPQDYWAMRTNTADWLKTTNDTRHYGL